MTIFKKGGGKNMAYGPEFGILTIKSTDSYYLTNPNDTAYTTYVQNQSNQFPAYGLPPPPNANYTAFNQSLDFG